MKPRSGDKLICIYKSLYVVTNTNNVDGKITILDKDGNIYSITKDEYPDMRQGIWTHEVDKAFRTIQR